MNINVFVKLTWLSRVLVYLVGVRLGHAGIEANQQNWKKMEDEHIAASASGHMHLKRDQVSRSGIWNKLKSLFGSGNPNVMDADVEDFFYYTQESNGKKLHLVHHATVFLPVETKPTESHNDQSIQSRLIGSVPWWLGGTRLRQVFSPTRSVMQQTSESVSTVAQHTIPTLQSMAKDTESGFEAVTERIKHEMSVGSQHATVAAENVLETASSILTRATERAEEVAEKVYHGAENVWSSMDTPLQSAENAEPAAQQASHNVAQSAEGLAGGRTWQRRIASSNNLPGTAPNSLLLGSLFALYLVLLRRRVWGLRKRTATYFGDGQIEQAQQDIGAQVTHESFISPPMTPQKSSEKQGEGEQTVHKTTVKYRRFNDLSRHLESVQQLNQITLPLVVLAISEMMGLSKFLVLLVGLALILGTWVAIELGINTHPSRENSTSNRNIGNQIVNLAITSTAVLASLQALGRLLV